ncbi:hypothetical protein M7I_4075 [Glarea lozoyensis 74030]|uniref:Aminoglycoside phosphotransferase domain-containing protein n=1 Tax=Glarea lozoyensis (strain ATCC 74030 / MF5533) TaxID=1104152 RepID=H0EN72_GLAL7|nr:hypothetical protein M7I_4075 [Glarea lozoyensis 74030]
MEKNEKIEKADEIEKVDEIEKAKKDEDEEAQRIKNEEYLNRLEKNNVELRAQRLAKNPEYYTRMAENIEDFVMKTEDFAHPEKVYPGLIYAKNRYPPEWAIESRKNLDDVKGYLLNAYDQVVHHELCWFCGLTAYEQAFTSYAPRLKILHTNSNTAPAPYNVEGGKLHDWILGNCNVPRPKCKMIGSSTDEWFGNIEEELREGLAFVHMTRDSAIIDREFQALKDNFPKPEPYVLTHGDLDTSNIIVKDGKITALIDWEHAGLLEMPTLGRRVHEREKHVIEPRGPYDPAMYPLRHMKLAWPLKN